jgi:sugar/nucleoside kinase (ribokinase family)
MSEIACLGILVADLIGRPIDQLPERGRLGLVDQMTLHIGGCAANTGIDLARLGVETAVLGKVGADGLGDFVTRTLESDGIDTSGVVRDPAVNTSATMVLVDAEGERTFLHYLGGNAAYRTDDVAWDAIRGCRMLHVAGALVMPGIDGQPMAEALRQVRSMGIVTSLDVVWDATGQWMKTLRPCLEHLDYFMPSLSEAQEITGRSDPREVASALRDAGAGTVALKLGTDGCYLQGPDGELSAPAFPVCAVDGTGSGDAFDAGLLVGILRGWDLERSARVANAVGALCVTGVGATAGVRSMQQVEGFLRERVSM